MIQIRQEQNSDYQPVYRLVQKAFASAEHSDGNEHDLVKALRGSDAFIPQLSLVAESAGRLAGYILFTKLHIGQYTELALAPLAVLPEYQRQGVGTALIEQGHRIARELGFYYSVVLGSNRYYGRFGYRPAGQYGIQAPFEVAKENFMALPLQGTAPLRPGTAQYAKEFGIGSLADYPDADGRR